MKILLGSIINVIALSCSLSTAADAYLDKQEFMPLGVAEAKYGKRSFSADRFKTGSVADRAAMSVALIKSRQFIGKTPTEVRTSLGESTGLFWSDAIPAYFVEEGWEKKGDSWQLVFLISNEGKINDVRIHKNCCPKK